VTDGEIQYPTARGPKVERSRSGHVLVTGGAGFIASHVVDLLLQRGDVRVTVLDKLTYAGNVENLNQHRGDPRHDFVRGDVADAEQVTRLVTRATSVVHAAAETFVDRSIAESSAFVHSNVLGTQVVLEACRRADKPLVVVSTDEVYGSIRHGSFGEEDPLQPNNPYAATKAGADLLCRAYRVTYGMPVTIVRGSNAFGPRQHPEKAIPTFALNALDGRRVPVYGDGKNRREWLFVRDFARAVVAVMDSGTSGETYNIGGGYEVSNLDLAREICRLAGAPEALVTFVADRPGHDFRYALDWTRIAELGWKPETRFHDGLRETVEWYREHRAWAGRGAKR
jgi:dTDP-glucose 4,6-dehydratase